MARDKSKIEQWDRYWSYGNIHSFSHVSEGNYEGLFSEFWRSRFRQLEPGSCIVDIATGNGAIALLALEESDRREAGFDIRGVDLADIDPETRINDQSLRPALRRLRFHARTPAESLPFSDRSVDFACSHFGIEYSDLAEAIPEVARVLKPGGRLAVIAHHQESVLLDATKRELEQLDFVLKDVKLYLRARNLLRAMSGAGRGDPKLQKKHRALQEAMKRIERAAGRTPNPSMLLGPARYIHEIFSASDRMSAREMLRWLGEALGRVNANQSRLLDMTAAALSEEGLHRLTHKLQATGLTGIEAEDFRQDDGKLLGWRVEAHQPFRS